MSTEFQIGMVTGAAVLGLVLIARIYVLRFIARRRNRRLPRNTILFRP